MCGARKELVAEQKQGSAEAGQHSAEQKQAAGVRNKTRLFLNFMLAAPMLLGSLGSCVLLVCRPRQYPPALCCPATKAVRAGFSMQQESNNAVVCLILLRYVQFTLLWSVGKLAPYAAAVCKPLLPDFSIYSNIIQTSSASTGRPSYAPEVDAAGGGSGSVCLQTVIRRKSMYRV